MQRDSPGSIATNIHFPERLFCLLNPVEQRSPPFWLGSWQGGGDLDRARDPCYRAKSSSTGNSCLTTICTATLRSYDCTEEMIIIAGSQNYSYCNTHTPVMWSKSGCLVAHSHLQPQAVLQLPSPPPHLPPYLCPFGGPTLCHYLCYSLPGFCLLSPTADQTGGDSCTGDKYNRAGEAWDPYSGIAWPWLNNHSRDYYWNCHD